MKHHIHIGLVGLSKFVQIKNKKMIKRLISIYVALIFSLSSMADEGMWLPQLLNAVNEKEMQELGLKLSKEDLYDINNSSLKDAYASTLACEMVSRSIKTEKIINIENL